jgi:hypothetical protein
MPALTWLLAPVVVGAVVATRWPAWRRRREHAADASAQLRRAVLARTLSEELATGAPDTVTAVVMDWNIGGDVVATLAAMQDGTTSLYFSKGGGILGAGSYENVREASTRFRTTAREVRNSFKPTDDFSLPGANHTRFFLVTPDATLATISVANSVLVDREHPLAVLGAAGQAVITQVRKVK